MFLDHSFGAKLPLTFFPASPGTLPKSLWSPRINCVVIFVRLLKLAAKDQVAPYLSDLLTSLYKVRQLPTDFSGTTFVRRWTVQLDKMRASDELGEDEIRQLLYDTENSYNAFMRLLGDMSNTFCSISLDVEKSSVFYHIQICPFKGM